MTLCTNRAHLWPPGMSPTGCRPSRVGETRGMLAIGCGLWHTGERGGHRVGPG